MSVSVSHNKMFTLQLTGEAVIVLVRSYRFSDADWPSHTYISTQSRFYATPSLGPDFNPSKDESHSHFKSQITTQNSKAKFYFELVLDMHLHVHFASNISLNKPPNI